MIVEVRREEKCISTKVYMTEVEMTIEEYEKLKNQENTK